MNQLRHLTVAMLLCSLPSADGGKVLVFPVDGSHWVNMKVLIEELHSRGHSITVVRPQTSLYIQEESPFYQSVTVDLGPVIDTDFIATWLRLRRDFNTSALSLFKAQTMLMTQLREFHRTFVESLEKMFQNDTLMQFLHGAEFDVALTDPCLGGGVLLAHRLGLPLVLNVRWTIMAEGQPLIAPSPLSYVPVAGTLLADKMTFWQRVKNVLFYLVVKNNERVVTESWYTPFVHRHFGSNLHYTQLVQAADIWLMRTDFTFDFPRPTMPNIVYMGGFQCKPSKPLPQHLEDFVQSSGDHGVIIMSLGTLVDYLPEDVSEAIAAAFAQLPQKIIWRYRGKRPSTLGNNTLLLDWLPQNDLLGHPKTRVFVAHGGTNGLQESIYHGVPIVGIPLLFDQDDNLFRMEFKGVAKVLDVGTLDKETFLDAVREVLYDLSYKEKMQALSQLHRDQPMKPLDQAMFWIEFVMRHRGARHLRTESYKMSRIQYHSIDVIAFLSVSVMLISLVFILTMRQFCNKLFRGKKLHTD